MPQTIDAILKNCNGTERHHFLKNIEKFLINGIEKDLVSTGMFQILLFHVCPLRAKVQGLEFLFLVFHVFVQGYSLFCFIVCQFL